jgi:hypothetical protein
MVASAAEEDILDETLEDKVGRVEPDADDQAGDQHDHDALDELILSRPLDLLKLAPRLTDEAAEAAARDAKLAGRLGRPHWPRAGSGGALRDLTVRRSALLLGAPGAALRSGLAGH